MFDSPATLPSVDRALNRLSEAMLLSTFSLPGTHRLHRPVAHRVAPSTTSDISTGSAANFRSQQLGNTEIHLITAARCPFLPASSSTIAGLAANQCSQQAASLHCGCLLITDAQPIMALLSLLYELLRH
jgi:hypothetical protein